MTVSTVTAPSVPGCLVITELPSRSNSAIGKPGRSRRSIERKPEKLPPVACAPHSITCPATTAPASASRSAGCQSHHHAAAPVTSEASATRPVTTTSAPRRSAAAIPKPPRYALAVRGSRSHVVNGAPVSRCASISPDASSSSMRPVMSSPSTWATCSSTPARASNSRVASASGPGSRPPALTTTLIPRSAIVRATGSNWRKKLDA